MSIKMAVTCLLLVAAIGMVSCDEGFSVDCSNRKFKLGGKFAMNVASILVDVLKGTPIQGEMDFSTETKDSQFKVFASGHCFNSRSTSSIQACSNCLKQAIDALKIKCPNGIRSSSGSSTEGCIVKYDNAPLKQ